MHEVKETQRATVHIGYDGRVHKTFKGPLARERFDNERRILHYLEKVGCPFVPRVLSEDADKLYLVTTNCGSPAPHISSKKVKNLFAELEQYGVVHNDPFPRNVTYRHQDGRFCLIDFEFATLSETGEGLTLEQAKDALPDAATRLEEYHRLMEERNDEGTRS
jgi:tRNA A-37 threonylcarbamoyl transferase component Bud32